MKTLIINGSPNGRKGNTEILCRRFVKGMQTQPEIRYVTEEDAATLAACMDEFDRWLFFFPMYVNAMPGIVKRLFEHMKPKPEKGVGYFVQYGFEEAAQSDYLRRILMNFTRRMDYQDLGLIVAGGMAGVRYMPERMNKKLFARLEQAGIQFERTGRFDEESIRLFGQPYKYSKARITLNRIMNRIGLTNIFWNSMLKKNNVYPKRFDKPFGS